MDKIEKLLEEYKLCQNTTTRLEETIWKTSAVLGLGSVGSLVLVISQKEKLEWQAIIILGILVFATSLIWWFMAKRWWDIQHATFLRMKHLEEELHFYQISYIYHKDGKLDLSPNGFDLFQPNVDELNKWNKRFHLRGVQSWLRLLPFFILISWLAYGFYRWNEETYLNSIQCLKQFPIYLLIAVFLGTVLFNWIRMRIETREASKLVNDRYKDVKKSR